jgi:hypothetical protein
MFMLKRNMRRFEHTEWAQIITKTSQNLLRNKEANFSILKRKVHMQLQ